MQGNMCNIHKECIKDIEINKLAAYLYSTWCESDYEQYKILHSALREAALAKDLISAPCSPKANSDSTIFKFA